MKQYIKNHIKSTFVLIAFISSPFFSHAQLVVDPCNDPNNPPPVGCPIDGGLTFLIAAGVGYGIKKVRDSRKEKQDHPEEAK